MKCLICGKEYNQIGQHLMKTHKITSQEYYDIYLKEGNEDACPVCGNKNTFYGLVEGYSKSCSVKCAANNKDVIAKRSATNLERYGVENVYASEQAKKKIKQTMKDRYGDEKYNIKKSYEALMNKYGAVGMAIESAKETFKNTCLEKYGVDNVLKSKEIRDKIKQTNLERYGVENISQSEEIQEKIKQTNLERYGVEHALSNDEVRQKIKQTNLERYGVDNVTKSEKIKNKIKKTCLERYGSEHWFSSEEGKRISREGQIRNLGDLNVRTREFKLKSAKTKRLNGTFNRSKQEDDLYDFIKSFYKDEIIRNDYETIEYDIDIYLPKLKLAIEHNGNYWHSFTSKRDNKDYHLNKSLLCRKKGIRLIHIYEFEDFNNQLNLLKQLILGNDLYCKKDFNKNNLINRVPEPEIIFSKDEMVIYGAGKLF